MQQNNNNKTVNNSACLDVNSLMFEKFIIYLSLQKNYIRDINIPCIKNFKIYKSYDKIKFMGNEFNLPDNISKQAKEELEKLLKGNRNFVSGIPNAQNMCVETLKKLALHQKPYAAVLACSDSRTIPEIIFDCGIGELFVVRVAGITTGPNIIESIEYSIQTLEVPLVILLGHDDCGVMKYANAQFPDEPEYYKSIMSCVYPALDDDDYNLHANEIAKKHTHYVRDVLMERSEIIRNAVEEGKTHIAICHFDHSTGLVDLID